MPHTPGPWTMQEPENDGFSEGIMVMAPKPFGASSKYFTDEPVAEICSDEEYQSADARLIAAAPDLLALCQDLLNVLGNAEWSTEAHGSAILNETVEDYTPKLRAVIAAAVA